MPLFSRRKIKHWSLTILIGGILLVGIPAFERATVPVMTKAEPGEMSLTVFDVGQGDSILAQEGSMQILVDGGSGDKVLEKLGGIMPAGDRTIELVILTHPHSDHVTGLNAVINQYNIGKIMKTDTIAGSVVDRDFNRTIKERNIPVDNPATVPVETVGNMVFKVLHYANQNEVDKKHNGSDDGLNDSSIVGILSLKNKKFLLMGDATTFIEDNLLADKIDLKADFIKIGHHGSAYSTSEAFLSAVAPTYAAISLGANNVYGFPAWRVLGLLKQNAIQYFRTDQDGDITAVTDGESLQVTSENVR